MTRLNNIRYLRVLACAGVFLTHFIPRMGATGWVAKAANMGTLGVYLFFLISGFLACRAKELSPGGGVRSVLLYYTKRLFRILPLYYAVILYNMALHSLILKDVPPDPSGLGWLRYFFLTNAVVPAPVTFWGNVSGTWTISLFCAFYLCAPLFIRLAKGVKSAAALYLAALLLRYLWVAAGLSSYMMVFYYMHFFLLGMLVRQLSEKYRPAAGTARLALLAAGTALVIKLCNAQNDYFIIWSWIFSAVILLTCRPDRQRAANVPAKAKGGLMRKLDAVIGVLDNYSYGIYLVHGVIFEGVILIQGKVELSPLLVLFLAVVLTAAGCWCARRLIERPAEKLCARVVDALRL